MVRNSDGWRRHAKIACSAVLVLSACAPGSVDGQTLSARIDEQLDACEASVRVDAPGRAAGEVLAIVGSDDRPQGATNSPVRHALTLRLDSTISSWIQVRDVRTNEILLRALVPAVSHGRATVAVEQVDSAHAAIGIRVAGDHGICQREFAVLSVGEFVAGEFDGGQFTSHVRSDELPWTAAIAWYSWNGVGSARLAQRKSSATTSGMQTTETPAALAGQRVLLDTPFDRWSAPVWCVEISVADG